MTTIIEIDGGARAAPEGLRRRNVLTGGRESPWFHLSCALNGALGGDRRMTFSARSHQSRQAARTVPSRAFWSATAGAIDLGCALLYGESEHCGCAWEKHRLTQGGGAERADEDDGAEIAIVA